MANKPEFIQNISGSRYSYFHPNVEYFPNGMLGYKYWMVFTLYFGQVGSSREPVLFENPTVVISNNGLQWASPSVLINPLHHPPILEEGELDQGGDHRQDYWSDTYCTHHNGKFEFYYRVNEKSHKSLRRIASNSPHNIRKLCEKSSDRSVVRQISVDGAIWESLEVAFISNCPRAVLDNHVVSPSFVSVGEEVISYEFDFNTGKEGCNDVDSCFVVQRHSINGLDFADF